MDAITSKIVSPEQARFITGGCECVLACGCFDLLHIGHIEHLQEARKHGQALVVLLTRDQYVSKGPGRPVFTQQQRADALAALACVDCVVINPWPTALEAIKIIQPKVYVKGSEYANNPTEAVLQEITAVRAYGGKVKFISGQCEFHSSDILNRKHLQLSKAAHDFLAYFNVRYRVEDLIKYLDGARDLRVLVVGEAIIDEYHYCQALGKSGKEPILAVRRKSSEKFAGGSLAVANHVAAFCDNVTLLTCLGETNSQQAFIRETLNYKITTKFAWLPGKSTTVKERFVEDYPVQKLFEVYQLTDEMDNLEQLMVEAYLAQVLDDKPDVVIVADYGHGMITPPMVRMLTEHTKFLAINAQTNAANHGFNTVFKYPRADYVSVSENEFRLATGQRQADFKSLLPGIEERLKCRQLMATRGRQGVCCGNVTEGFVDVPALADGFKDRIGAGDAVLAVTSLCAAQDASAEILGLLGSATGALAVEIIGNRTPVSRKALEQELSALVR